MEWRGIVLLCLSGSWIKIHRRCVQYKFVISLALLGLGPVRFEGRWHHRFFIPFFLYYSSSRRLSCARVVGSLRSYRFSFLSFFPYLLFLFFPPPSASFPLVQRRQIPAEVFSALQSMDEINVISGTAPVMNDYKKVLGMKNRLYRSTHIFRSLRTFQTYVH